MNGRAKRIIFGIVAAALGSSIVPGLTHAQEPAALEARRDQQLNEYERLSQELTVSRERAAEIEAEIAEIRKDHASLSAALVQAAKTERKLSEEVIAIADRLDVLGMQERDLRESLHERRGVLAEVLGALQRMGLNPPPAILVRPEDALSSVRSSILLAAVVPELRGETQVLLGDLQELTRITATMQSQRERLVETVTAQAGEQERLSLLLEEKRQVQQESEISLAEEEGRAEELAQQTSSVRELIDALEAELEIALKQAEELAALPPGSPSSPPVMGGSVPFSALSGLLELPVAGRVVRRFSDNDDAGRTMQGDMVATHSGAIVTAPVDASVLFARPFRSYGQLLILNAGDGYHIVLAGMERISVTPGQAVLAGEPVGLMGESRVANAMGFSDENTGPELYVEFRKEGKPVDPAPWWVERSAGRTRNDT